MPYRAPLKDFRFLFDHIVGFDCVTETERFAEATPEVVEQILNEAGRMCEEVLAPLNRAGDENPAKLENGVVRTSPGFDEGYKAIAEGGWVGMAADPEYGGMGLPMTVASAVNEMMSSACLSLQLCPMLSQGQIEALEHHASEELKQTYLTKLTSGEWSGTMNLTEPQAGSDVGALRSKAEPNDDGSYNITGQKIYITWGDAEFLPNVVHLVLARLPDAAPGTKGISLFLVPKYLPKDDGTPGEPNDLRVVSLEHKMGIHGSPTCVMEYSGAKGWLVGQENKGMAAMFTMMNNARLGVGVQGIGVGEAAYQHALAYALDRTQGKAEGTGTIVEHADVRRMLTGMKADLFAARSIAMMNAVAIDMATATGDTSWKARAALLTPITKAFGTDIGNEVAHEGVQVHGGMGFVEETGAAQYSRDARITPIYEGTNGIQSMDLVARKMMDGGDAAFALIDEMQAMIEEARKSEDALAQAVWDATEALRDATDVLVAQDMQDRFAGAVPYLRAFARVLGGVAHLRAAVKGDAGRRALAAFYIERLLPEHASLLVHAKAGADGLYALTLDDLAAA
ncbi:Acyl-CoA dehydrogenase, short-chain specific [Rhodobacteraceae bacterium THAF1]|uniref:acyl-CoA dehydrogenase n=1 Tax=Palleronia sp. THAF1 TaxID=2587842 RepID=UPI000F3EB155|nr:acyl-CoA dehydrogenase [Palleronia sp. THAF1]QFU09835.1 Acyl-CoA dehydrogenase, short-chain specific [Palleronia sp. THAF1]VDC17262.1 Acyl-CoA dehydrogenase, short-chain specific [Rhodobacteraceae bacterium THAF1]